MTEKHHAVRMPPVLEREDGQPRRIGVEIETIGPSISELSDIVAAFLGGDVREISRYEHEITGDDAGKWTVKLDMAWLVEKGRSPREGEGALELLDELAEMILRAGAEQLVPLEIVTPPIPMLRLPQIQTLITELREAGAQGTRTGLTYAFGMQLNPEMPALDAATIARYLKSFACLYEWLEARSSVDSTRKLTGYVSAYPARYVRRVADPDYWPGLDALIDDYLEDNPTRNRALDMLPLFLHLDEERVRAVVKDERVKSRPALHYRLPNCEVDQENWGIDVAWGDWLEVERLAADDERLEEICVRYCEHADRLLDNLLTDWAEEVEAWIEPQNAR